MKVFKAAGATQKDIERDMAEALLSSLGHPNIVEVYDANVLETKKGNFGYFRPGKGTLGCHCRIDEFVAQRKRLRYRLDGHEPVAVLGFEFRFKAGFVNAFGLLSN